jgi:3-hydroxybutyryl-CoA dehydratase
MKKVTTIQSLRGIQIEDIKIGMEASYSQTITDADVKIFSGISGDKNPLHMDDEYAQNSQFKKRIAHGLLSASFFSALFGTQIPGEGCVYVSQSLKFLRPVYLGDTVLAKVKVSKINLESRRIFFKTSCEVNKKIVTIGEAEIYQPPVEGGI